MENFFKNFFKPQYVNAVVTAVFDTLSLLTSNQRRRAGAPKKFSNHVKHYSTIEEHGLGNESVGPFRDQCFFVSRGKHGCHF